MRAHRLGAAHRRRDVGTTPIFNWLLYGYGVPALAFWLAGCLLRRRADDVPARMVDAGRDPVHGAAAFARNPPLRSTAATSTTPRAGLTEVALQVCGGLAMAIGLERLRVRTRQHRARCRRR